MTSFFQKMFHLLLLIGPGHSFDDDTHEQKTLMGEHRAVFS